MFDFEPEPEDQPAQQSSLSSAFVAMVALTMLAMLVGGAALFWVIRVAAH
ncbi:hypothetical protein FB565_006770 [Actinoplanes lutulentus]|uniref:Uncharacterized protein n=1 Tax=Actinoplanes lutulentus TaxID=1287878 RepID=A0A327Z5W1_9ACTN|nr:hypothetical protein [Actinoplanes lutulentus]MBB2947002.1 hypothetical protein [Actinoplanes lutulentus]RAK30503.1 hypothetical protein B0I29_116162 [Actinoplanes lutulentus]